MPSEVLRILEALVKAKIALHESSNHDHRPHWVGVTCPSCGVDYRSVSAVDGETRFNPHHDPKTGEFTSDSGAAGEKAVEIETREKTTFYHGSPHRFDVLKERSYVTPDIETAREFGHIIYKFEAHQDEPVWGKDPWGRRVHTGEIKKGTVSEIHVQTIEKFRYALTHEPHKVEIFEEGSPPGDWQTELKKLTGKRAACSVLAVDRKSRLEERRLPSSKIHKAGSAESILRHCLRQLGLTSLFKRGELTQAQHRDLLEAIRQYGRAWLRHESEQFLRVELGRSNLSEKSLVLGSDFKDMDSVYRAFFHPEDKGFFANLGRFFRRTKQFIRELIVAGVQAILGPAPLTGEDLDAAEREAQRQEQFFDRFHDEIKQGGKPQPRPEPIPGMEEPLEPPVMTPGQFTARVEKYADSAWQAPQRINRDKATQQGIFKLERRILGVPKTEHCSDCPPLAELGWQPIGTLPAIGESECGPLCLCHFEYTEEEGKPPAFDGGMTREEYNAIIKRVEEYEPEFTATVVMGED